MEKYQVTNLAAIRRDVWFSKTREIFLINAADRLKLQEEIRWRQNHVRLIRKGMDDPETGPFGVTELHSEYRGSVDAIKKIRRELRGRAAVSSMLIEAFRYKPNTVNRTSKIEAAMKIARNLSGFGKPGTVDIFESVVPPELRFIPPSRKRVRKMGRGTITGVPRRKTMGTPGPEEWEWQVTDDPVWGTRWKQIGGPKVTVPKRSFGLFPDTGDIICAAAIDQITGGDRPTYFYTVHKTAHSRVKGFKSLRAAMRECQGVAALKWGPCRNPV